jgi:quercetin dioxygenase-like cupin family protein
MQVIDHQNQAEELWRPGVTTRMLVSTLTGSVQLCIFQQWCAPGRGAPTHLHAVEEVLTVLDGVAEVWVGPDKTEVNAGQSIIVPAGLKHGFRNTGETTLHVQATLASATFEASFDAANEISRRWLPQA